MSKLQPAVPSTDVFKKDIFNGKVLFCTGGGSGICQKMTEAMMTHGANAFIVGRRENVLKATSEALQQTTGRKCGYASADVRNFDSLSKAVERCVEQFGRLDFVICGAAGNFLSPIDGSSPNAFKTVIEIDLLGTFNTIKATIAHIKKSHGSYISVSATLHYTGILFQAHSSAAKAGIDALSRVLAIECGPFGVRSNIIAPGPIRGTEGVDRLLMGAGDEAARKIPIGRLGELDDIANATVFLFSPAASNITGAAIISDGGEYHLRSSIGPSLDVYPDFLLETDSKEFRKLLGGSKL